MKRLAMWCMAGVLVTTPVHVLAQGASASKPPAAAQKGKTLSASGTVSAVTDASLTVKGKATEWTFTIDSDTNVVGRGLGTKAKELKKEGKKSAITEYVKVGDTVTVRYNDLGATKHAATVNVTTKAAK